MFRMAVRRKSWGTRAGTPAARRGAFLQERNVRARSEFPGLHEEGEHPLERRQLTVDGAILDALRLPPGRVVAGVGCRDVRHSSARKERLEVRDVDTGERDRFA